ncbi:MAG: FecR domain-containing protein, partial [Anaerotignum sp.]|nr:FecR domain-containing protein [Anaerotignum sp.]
MRMKKFLTFLLTFAMVVSLLPAAAFAANNTATTMRLAKTQGTVAVTNATGKQVTQTSNMKLYNGYQIKTGAKSYAWISLDDTKAAKLDANSVVSVQKSGQKLTLYLSSGNIFFNVKEKLSGGESFHIKTSTMTTGIRGTSGCVRVVNPRVTEIHLLTGEINVYTENPELHISKTAVLTAGQKATSLIAEEAVAATGEQADIIIETLTSHEVCGNCSVEIAADPELVERIEEEAPHLLPEKIADEAEDRLEADEEAAEEKQAAIEEAVNNQTLPEDVDPYFEKEEAGGGGGGGSSASVDENTVYEWDKLIEKINEFNAGTEDMTITLGENLPNAADLTRGTPLDVLPAVENAAGKTLTLNLSNYILGLNDTLVNETPLIITNADGYIGLLNGYNSANVAITNRDTLTLKNGTILTYGGNTGLQNDPGATFKMQGGSFEVGFIDADPATNELVLDAASADVDYSEAINNRAGAFVEMSGGTINADYGIYDKSASVGVEPNVTITGGTIHV